MSKAQDVDKLVEDLLAECKTLAQKERTSDMLGIDFSWPGVNDQIIGKGKRDGMKRGRAKYKRDMFVIPGFETRGHAPFPGFMCHPEAALASAAELIRLVKESKDVVSD